MNVLIIQPPIVQLNTAYPSGAYLKSFFSSLGCQSRWLDLNIHLFYKIFSPSGLKRIFELSSKKAMELADKAQKNGDEETAFNLRRYLSQKDLWIQWIDFITAILRPGKRDSISSGYENAHRFVFGAHVPRGSRMENYLSNLEHDLTTDDARSLASFALADLADFITIAFDSNFSLVRYAESLTVSESTFDQVEKGADSPIIKEFYLPLLEELFPQAPADLLLISVPFPGTFAAALATGRYFKSRFGNKVYISMGGGFINTELRETNERSLSKYCHAICYDRGYASYKQLVTQKEESGIKCQPIFKLRQFLSPEENSQDDTAPADKKDFSPVQNFSDENIKIIPPLEDENSPEYKEALAYEKEVTMNLIPDFSDIDFSQYPRLIDDTNPMHRLWSDGSWLKAYMAHGCYWHKCAFCDVTLDYVKGYCPTNVSKLYQGLLDQCRQKGIYGIHFVDEAMPPAMMIAFARENIAHGSPITWWGNVRFEKIFTRDVADFLSYGGLIGVSAGLESATGNGLNAIHKGTDLESIVAACCAFKEAGILVHAYMIYGYWWESPQDLINSMETLRQFYKNGLLDSSFWHKFVLTRHSRVYKEWKEGKISDLKPIDPLEKKNVPLFAKNGLHFQGEEKSQKYGPALDYSLNQWMHGQDLDTPVQKWFDFQLPRPSVPKDFIENLIAKYENKRDEEFKKMPDCQSNKNPASKSDSLAFIKEISKLPPEKIRDFSQKLFWLGGEIISLPQDKISWFYMGEYYTAKKNAPEKSFRGKGLCLLP